MLGELDLGTFRAEIEAEREWREREIRLLRNHAAALESEGDRVVSRKALVTILYAHFEGLCRFMLALYLQRVNALGLKVVDASPALAAASTADVFAALRNPDKKCKEFARTLPDDAALHRFARDREFTEVARTIEQRPLAISEDEIADPEANLKPVVLRKILYRMGLDPALAKPWEGSIHMLLNYRNGIAHGSSKNGPSDREYAELEQAVKLVFDSIAVALSDALRARRYRK